MNFAEGKFSAAADTKISANFFDAFIVSFAAWPTSVLKNFQFRMFLKRMKFVNAETFSSEKH